MKRTKPRLSLTRLFWAPRPLVFLLVYGVAWPAQVLAAPQGEKVVHGKATFARDGNVTTIHASDKAIINYQKFGIAQDETVEFVQPSEAARVLNRVTGFESSQIDGSLRANGIVYLLNPQGIFFGSQAIVDVGGMVAAAGHMSNDDFVKGIDHFTQLEGTVSNAGEIHGRAVSLLGRHVTNMGAIRTENGVIAMVAGDEIWLGPLHGHVMVKLDVSELQDGAGIQNTGTLDAGKGRVSLAAGDMYAVAAQLGGTIRGKDIQVAGGENGLVDVTGTLDASDRAAGQTGGNIEVTGDRIALHEASLDASGDAGGGTIHVGGAFQGKGATPTARRTYVSKGSTLRADAETRGDGGEVVVWADEITGFVGHASARGGAQSGDGGMIEVSGKETLLMRGTADTRAPAGKTGMLLLDPQDITISDEDDGDGADDDQISVSDGTVLQGDGSGPTDNFTISAGALEGVSATTNISLAATRDITVADLGSGPADEILDLQTGSNNSVTFTADADNAGGGNFSMADIDDTIQTAGGSLTIVGEGVTVGFLTTNGGAVTLDAKGGTADIQRTINSGNGAILVRGDDIDIDTAGTEGFLNSGTATTTLRDSDGGGIEFGGAEVAGRFNLNDDELDNITAALIKLETTGDVEVEGVTTSQAVSIDPLTVTFAADASFGALTVEADNGITIDPTVTVTTAGTTILNADFVPGDDDGAFTVGADATLTTTNNALTITADEIAIDLTAGDEGTVTSGTAATTIIDSDADGINLNPAADVAGDLNLTNAEIARITSSGGLTFQTGGTITATGVTTAAAHGSVTLDAATLENVTNTGQVVFSTAASTFFGALTVRADDGIDAQQNVTSNGTTILDADNDTDGTGDFSIAATRTLSTTDDALTITANDVALLGTLDSGTAATTLADSDGTGIGLGATAVANGLNLDGAELQQITANGLTLQTAGAITVNGITAANSDTVNTVTLDAGTTIAFTGAASTFDSLDAGANTGITVAVEVTTDTGNLALDGDDDANGTGTVAFTGLRTLDAAGLLTLDGGVPMTGTAGLVLTADDGITLAESLTTNGVTTIDADDDAPDNNGTFTVATGETLSTTNNALSVTANDVALAGSINTGTAATTIVDSDGTGIGLGATAVANGLNLDGTELQQITANGLTLQTAGAITVNGITAANSDNVNTVTLDAGTTIAFATAASTFDGLLAQADAGISVGANVTTDTSDLSLDGDADNNMAGTVAFTGTRTLDATGVLTLDGGTAMTGSAGLNLIGDDGVVFAQSLTTNGATVIDADDDTDGTGDFTVALGQTIATTNGTLSVTANDIALAGTLDSGTAATTLIDSDGTGIGLGATAVANGLNLDGAELQQITANGLTLQTAGAITVNGITAANSDTVNTVTLDAGTTIAFTGAASTFDSLDAGANTGITVAVEVTTDTGNLALDGDDDANGTGTVAFTGLRTLDAAGLLTLDGGVPMTGTAGLVLTADDGITLAESLTTNGVTTIDADDDAPDNNGTFTVATGETLSTTNNALSVTANDVDLAGSTTSGAAATTIVDSDGTGIGLGATAVANGLNVSGAELQRITASALTLQTAGAITVNGITEPNSDTVNTVTLDAATTIAFTGASTFDGLDAQADAGITVGADVTTDTSGLSLDGDADNNMAGTVAFTGTRTLDAAGVLTLDGATAMTGTLGLNLFGDDGVVFAQSLTTNGATSIDADDDTDGTGDFSVALGQTIATTNGTLSVTANDVALLGTLDSGTAATTIVDSDASGINLNPAVDVAGDLNLSNTELGQITSTGLIFQSGGAITATGATTAAAQGAVTLDAATLGGQVQISGAVGSSFASLTTTGPTAIDADVTTTNAQTYADDTTIGGAAPRTLTGSQVTFGDAATDTLAVNTATTITGPVDVNATTTLTAGLTANAGAGANTIDGTVDGAAALTLSAGVGGSNAINAEIGGTAPLTAVTTAGTTTISQDVTTTGVQTYADDTTIAGAAPRTLSGSQVTFGDAASDTLAVNAVTTVNASMVLNATTTLAADLTANSGALANVINGAVNGAAALALNAPAGSNLISAEIGGTTPLTAVSTTGLTSIAADVTTTGAQTYADATTLDGAAPRTLTASQVTFGDTAAEQLVVNTTATIDAPTDLNASAVLLADLTINGGAGATTIDGPVDGATALALNSTGAGSSAINAAVGGTTPLATVTTTGTTTINADVTTTGAQDYADNTTIGGAAPRTLTASQVTFGSAATDTLAVNTATTVSGPMDVNATTTLAANLTANAGAGANTIDGTVNGAGALALNSTGAGSSAINAAIGGTTPLTSVSTSGTTTIGADVRTSGAQTYADDTTIAGAAPRTLTGSQVTFGDSAADTLAVNTATTVNGPVDINATTTLAANLTANAAAGANTIDGTVDGAAALALNSTGAGSSAINAAIGGSTPLATVSTTGTTAINADVTTTGAQTYADNTTIAGAAPRTLTASQVTFGNAAADTLAVNTATTVNGPVDVNATTTLTANLTANAGAGANTIDGTMNGAGALALNSTGAGSSAVNAAIGGTTPLTSVATTGTTAINADVTTTGAQTYADNTTIAGAAPRTLTGSQVTFGDSAADTLAVNTATTVNGPVDINATTMLAANLTANAAAGANTIDGTVDGAAALALNSTGAGSSAINAAIGGSTPLATVSTTGTTAINADVTTTGAQTYADNTTIAGAAPRTLTASQVTFGDTAADTLAVNTATTINGPVDVNATTTLAADLTANAGGGATTIDGTVNGAVSLALNSTGAGSSSINAAIGGTTPLATVSTTGTTAINADVTTAGAQTYADNTAIAGAAPRTLTGSQVTFGDAASDTLAVNTATTVNGPVDVNATTTLAANLTANAGAGANTIDGTVNGAGALALNSTGAGSSAINAAIGGTTPLTSVSTSGTTTIGADVRTSGAQTYADDTTIAGAAPRTLTASQVTFGDAASDTLAVNTATTIAGPLDANATTTLAANLTANAGGGTTTIDGPIDGGAVLALNSTGGGRSAINAPIGAAVPLSTVTTSGNTTLAANVTTSGDQTYANAVTVGSDSVARSTAAGNLRFGSTVSGGGADLTANTSGVTTFVGAVNVANLTTDAGGTTAINGGSVTTSGDQSFGDAVTLGATTRLRSTGGGNIALGDTLDGPVALTVETGGVASFRGDIGGMARLTTFETEPVGTILFGAGVDLSANTVRFGTSSGDSVIRSANAATVAGEGDLSFDATSFLMGRGEKLTVAGDLSITAGSADLGDLNALSVDINSGSIRLLSRPAGNVVLTTVDANGNSLSTPSPTPDDGMDIVANSIRFSSIPTIAPFGTQTFSVVLSTANGSNVTGAVPTDQQFAQRAIFSTLRPLTRADLEGPVAGGIPSGTAPDLLGRGVVVSGCLDCQNTSLINQDETSLWDLAEAPEPPPTPDEVLAFLNECDPEKDPNCKDEAGEGESAQLGNEAALDAQELYRELVKSKSTTDRVGPVLQAGVEHCRQSGAGGGTALRSCLASNAEYGDAVGYLDRLELLFAQFTKLGLAPGGLQSMREEILTEIINVLSLEGITPQDLGEAIGPNAALPEGGTGV